MADVRASSIRYRGLIAPEEPEATGDGRLFARASLTHRRLPAPGMFNRSRTQGHQDSVTVARLEGVEYVPGQGWVGSGAFLDPSVVPEAVEAVYLVREGLSRPSVDLEPDLSFDLVAAPNDPNGRPRRRITRGTIMGFTFVPYTAFDQVEILVTDEADQAILASAGITFAVNGSSWRSMPIAGREQEYDFKAAIGRMLEWSRGQPNQFQRGFLYRDQQGNPASRGSYHLPIADILNGRLTLVPRAVFSAAVFLSGGHGGLPNISDKEQEQIRGVLTEIYDVLRDSYGDPRVVPPWQRGGRQGAQGARDTGFDVTGGDMPKVNYRVDTDTGAVTSTSGSDITLNLNLKLPEPETFQDDGECGNLDTSDAADLNTAARECAASRGWAMEGGRYPIRSEEMHGAADLQKAIRAVGRGGGSHDAIRKHIMKRARSLGLSEEIPENWTSGGGKGGDDSSGLEPATFQDQEECPEGKVRNDDGECVDREDDSDSGGSQYQVTAASIPTKPPRAWFSDPGLANVTALTVADSGQVSGHLATWNECHMGVGNRCVTAPRSKAEYRYFRTGEVVCDDDSKLAIGKITLGTGHADMSLGLIPAAEHYDNTGTVAAIVNVGEDAHGIWVAGSLIPGVDEQKVAELRRSPLSGDWRRTKGNLELVAALAVNSGGFPVLRASVEARDELEVLLSAGIVTHPTPESDRAQRWQMLENEIRTDRVKQLLEA